MTSSGTHCNFFIALSIRLKAYRSFGRVSGVLRGIGEQFAKA